MDDDSSPWTLLGWNWVHMLISSESHLIHWIHLLSLRMTFQLPPERSKLGLPDQGWTISTEVKQSLIAGSGNGRFAKESTIGGSRVLVKKLVPMQTVTSLSELTGDSVVTFSSEDDLERYIQCANNEAGLSRAQILDLYENFMYGLDGDRSCLNISTYTTNHADGDRITMELNIGTIDGCESIVGTALGKDIAEGQELTIDYRRFKLPLFYLDYCKKNSITDVRTLVLNIVDGK